MAQFLEVIEIASKILPFAELAKNSTEVAKQAVPEPPAAITDKRRWIEVVIQNKTQFQINIQGSTHFDSGRYWDAPSSVDPFSQMVFTACNGDNTLWTGASGGTPFRLNLDDSTFLEFAVGWTAPFAGHFKLSVVESNSAKAGYDTATENGNAVDSKHQFKGKDTNGNETKFHFHLSAAPGQKAKVVVSQVRDA